MHPYEDRFMFHANAVPFGARFAAPLAAESRAATTLPSIGGRTTASESAYLLDGGFVRFEAAGSEVVGEELPGENEVTVFRTRATSWITGLRVDGLLEIGDLAVTLESRYEMRAHEPAREPSFLGLSVEHDDLTVCGEAWMADESPALAWINRQPTYEQVQQDLVQQRASRNDILDHLYCAGQQDDGANRLVPMSDPAALKAPEAVSIFGLTPPELKSGPPIGDGEECVDLRPAVGGYYLEWPNKKTTVRFYFGEYVVSRGYRRFTAVRMVMTRSPRSHLVIGEVALNGSKHP